MTEQVRELDAAGKKLPSLEERIARARLGGIRRRRHTTQLQRTTQARKAARARNRRRHLATAGEQLLDRRIMLESTKLTQAAKLAAKASADEARTPR